METQSLAPSLSRASTRRGPPDKRGRQGLPVSEFPVTDLDTEIEKDKRTRERDRQEGRNIYMLGVNGKTLATTQIFTGRGMSKKTKIQ